MELKPVLQSIEMDSKWIQLIESNDKKVTFREGLRDFREGRVILFNLEKSWCISRNITKVDFIKLKDVPEDVIKKDGYVDFNDALLGMRKYYPNITPDSMVTLTYWD